MTVLGNQTVEKFFWKEMDGSNGERKSLFVGVEFGVGEPSYAVPLLEFTGDIAVSFAIGFDFGL